MSLVNRNRDVTSARADSQPGLNPPQSTFWCPTAAPGLDSCSAPPSRIAMSVAHCRMPERDAQPFFATFITAPAFLVADAARFFATFFAAPATLWSATPPRFFATFFAAPAFSGRRRRPLLRDLLRGPGFSGRRRRPLLRDLLPTAPAFLVGDAARFFTPSSRPRLFWSPTPPASSRPSSRPRLFWSPTPPASSRPSSRPRLFWSPTPPASSRPSSS